MTITEPTGEIHLERMIEPPRAPGDAALIAVVGLAAGALAAWLTAMILVLAPVAEHTRTIGVAVATVAVTMTLVALNLGLDLSRRRRLRRTFDKLHTTAAASHDEIVDNLASLAREVEQLSAKVSTTYWQGYEAGATDIRGGDGGATVARLPHRA